MSEKEQPVTSEAAPAEETPPAEKEAPAAPTIEEKYVGEKVNPSAQHHTLADTPRSLDRARLKKI